MRIKDGDEREIHYKGQELMGRTQTCRPLSFYASFIREEWREFYKQVSILSSNVIERVSAATLGVGDNVYLN